MEERNDQAQSFLCCPICRSELADASGGMRCTGGHTFGSENGLPVLVETMPELPEEEHRVFGINYEPLRYVWLMLLLTAASKVWIPAERRRVIQSLALRPGDRVLDHCAGSGGNYAAIWSMIGSKGKLVAMDLSSRMLRVGLRRAGRRGMAVEAHVADAVTLPYADESFDAVVHVGAIQQFGDAKREAIAEMLRVTRPGGQVLIVDENLESSRKDTWWGRYLARLNPLFLDTPPIDLVPEETRPELSWVLGGICFQIVCRKPA